MTCISVIVPCYNSSAYVENCLGMLQTQTFKDFEVICVNDGSTDNTEVLCKKFSDLDNRFKIFSQENKGLGGARNTGIKFSKGKYITFIDSDDWVFPDYLETLVTYAENQDLDIVDAFHKILLPDGKVHTPNKWFDQNRGKDWTYIFSGHAPSSVWCRLYKKSLIVDNNLYFPEKRIHEDLNFTYRAYYYSKSSATIDKILYIWNRREDSLSRTFTIKHFDDLLETLREDYEFATNNFRDKIEYFSMRKLFIVYKILSRIKYIASKDEKLKIVSLLRTALKSDPLLLISKIDADNSISVYGDKAIERINLITKDASVGVLDIIYQSLLSPQIFSLTRTVSQIEKNQLRHVTFTYIILEILRSIGVIKYKASRNATIWWLFGKIFCKIKKRNSL